MRLSHDKFTCVIGLAFIVGCGDRGVIEVGGTGDAVVFAVHLDGQRNPISTSGPYRLDNGTSVMTEIPPDETGRRDDTEYVAFDLARVEEATATLDQSVRKNLRFSRTRDCWISRECSFELEPGLPVEGGIIRKLGQSIGWREFVPSTDLTTRPDDSESELLSQLRFRAPFDQHLDEPTKLVQFSEAATWGMTLPGGNPGIRDFFPVDLDKVVIAAKREVCLIQRSTPASDYCKSGPATISASELAEVPEALIGRIAQARDANGYLNRFYVTVRNDDMHRLFSIDIEGEVFGEVRLLALEATAMLNVAVGTDGTIIVTLFPEPGETLQRILEFSPDGTTKPSTEIRWAVGQPWVQEVAVTTNPQVPFLIAHSHFFAGRQAGNVQSPWFVMDLPTRDDERTEGIAGIGAPGDLHVWTVRDEGVSVRLRQAANFQAQQVDWAMPDEYVELCEPGQEDFDNRLTNDLRGLYIAGLNDGFAVLKQFAVVVRFDPTAQTEEELRTVSVFHTGRINTVWPRINGELEPLRFAERDGVLWVGGGAALYSLQTRRD